MKVAKKRWGEVTIKKQGERKNIFDKTKSFSIIKTNYKYTIEELKEIFEMVVELTEKYKFQEMKEILSKLEDERNEKTYNSND